MSTGRSSRRPGFRYGPDGPSGPRRSAGNGPPWTPVGETVVNRLPATPYRSGRSRQVSSCRCMTPQARPAGPTQIFCLSGAAQLIADGDEDEDEDEDGEVRERGRPSIRDTP